MRFIARWWHEVRARDEDTERVDEQLLSFALRVTLAGADFFTTEVWTCSGLVTYYTLFLLDLKSRRVQIVGSTRNPDSAFMAQAARRLTDAVDGFLAGHRVLICGRDGKWTDGFRGLLEGAGVRVVRTPVQAPNANAYAERFVRSIREECLDRLILFGERRFQRVLEEFLAHYHGERNHQGLGNDLVAPPSALGPPRLLPRAIGRSAAVLLSCGLRMGRVFRHYENAAGWSIVVLPRHPQGRVEY